jgi:predicted nucleotidyltransferase
MIHSDIDCSGAVMAEPLTHEGLRKIVTAILSVSQPAAIILFGSYARDQVHEFSDVDLLVIRDAEFREGESRRKELGRIYRSVTEACATPKDIILFTRDEVSAWRNTTNHMISVACREGRVLYGQV